MIFINKIVKLLCLILTVAFFFNTPTFAAEETPVFENTKELSDKEQLVNNEELFSAIEDEYSKLEEKINIKKEELDNINSDINDNIQRLAVINSEVDILNNQIKLLNEELNSLNFSIEIINKVTNELTDEIDALTVSINQTNDELIKLKPELEKVTDEVQDIIRNEYVSGEPSYLEIIITSTSMEEYLTRKELYNRVREEKEEKMNKTIVLNNKLIKNKEKMEKERTALENDKLIVDSYQEKYNETLIKQEEVQESLINKKSNVTEHKNEVKEIISELDTESKVYKQQIKRDQEEMEYLSAYVDNYIAEYGSKLNDVPDIEFNNNGQMIWPVYFPSYLSATFPAYSDGSAHWGIDICAEGGNSYGRPFNAAQGGKVILAVNDNNYNSGFGNYCVVDHGDGTSTLYAHARNLVVSKGDVVRQGETLGYIGSTGNVTGPHLHFEVRVKNSDGDISRVNPLNYVKNA